MYWTIRFNIANQQDEYVKCLQFIDCISEYRKNNFSEKFLRRVEYCSSEKMLSFSTVMKRNVQNCYDEWPQIKQELPVYFKE